MMGNFWETVRTLGMVCGGVWLVAGVLALLFMRMPGQADKWVAELYEREAAAEAAAAHETDEAAEA